jgi:Fic family protein
VDAQPDEADKEALIARADSAYVQPPTFAEFLQAAEVELGPWERARNELEKARSDAPADPAAGATTYLLRAAAVETGAIEGLYTTDRGFTFTVAEDVLAIEQLAVEKGEEFVRLFDAQLASFEMALDAATNAVPLSESWLRQLHEITTAGQETYRVITAHGVQERPLPRGDYKHSPNHVLLKDGGTHSYAPVAETPREVRRVIEQLRTEEFQSADAIHQAAYAHYALVAVHPFSDGNGRVVRALASVFLLRAASVPLLIYSDQTAEYFDALAASDDGDHLPFTQFIRDRAIAVARQATAAIQIGQADDKAISSVVDAFYASSGVRHEDLDNASQRIAQRLHRHLKDVLKGAQLPKPITYEVTIEHTRPQYIPGVSQRPKTTGWRAAVDGNSDLVVAVIRTPPPAPASVTWHARIEIATTGDPAEAFDLATPNEPPFLIGLSEAHPDMSHELDARLKAKAEGVGARLVRELSAAVQTAKTKRGY